MKNTKVKIKNILYLLLILISTLVMCCKSNNDTCRNFYTRMNYVPFKFNIRIDSTTRKVDNLCVLKFDFIFNDVQKKCSGYLYYLDNGIYFMNKVNNVLLFNYSSKRNTLYEAKLQLDRDSSENGVVNDKILKILIDTTFFDKNINDSIFMFRFKEIDSLQPKNYADMVIFIGKSVGIVGYYKSYSNIFLSKMSGITNNPEINESESIYIYEGNIFEKHLHNRIHNKNLRFVRIL